MRITFTMTGGFAALPGLRRPLVVDLDALPEGERAEAERLIDAARLLDPAAPLEASQPSVPDGYTYTITAESGGRSRSVHLADPIADPALGALVDWLRERQRRR